MLEWLHSINVKKQTKKKVIPFNLTYKMIILGCIAKNRSPSVHFLPLAFLGWWEGGRWYPDSEIDGEPQTTSEMEQVWNAHGSCNNDLPLHIGENPITIRFWKASRRPFWFLAFNLGSDSIPVSVLVFISYIWFSSLYGTTSPAVFCCFKSSS